MMRCNKLITFRTPYILDVAMVVELRAGVTNVTRSVVGRGC